MVRASTHLLLNSQITLPGLSRTVRTMKANSAKEFTLSKHASTNKKDTFFLEHSHGFMCLWSAYSVLRLMCVTRTEQTPHMEWPFIGAQAWTIVLATCAMGISMNQRSLLRCSDSKDIIRSLSGYFTGILIHIETP